MLTVGLDVHQRSCAICVLDQDGRQVTAIMAKDVLCERRSKSAAPGGVKV